MRNVIFAAPFPLETTLRFARAAARLDNVRLLLLGQDLPSGDDARVFADAIRVADGLSTEQLVDAAKVLIGRHGPLHRVIGILEPLQVQLAELRRAFGVPGTDPKTADLFRDKARMKEELRRHGLPCARHQLIRSAADADAFVQKVGFPLVLKPPAGMGCKATWRIQSMEQLGAALRTLGASDQRPALAEEFLRGKEHSFETIVVGGEVRFSSLSRYYPSPLEVMETPWIQWVVVLPRDIDGAEFADATELGVRAVQALGLDTGFTHMEWFRRDDGSLAIGEIAARPPGAHIVLANSYAHDADMYRAWARATIDDSFDGPYRRKFAVGVAYLRGPGHGRVARVTGVDRVNERIGHLVVESRLPQPGAPKSDSYEGDGYVIVRDPDTEAVKQAMAFLIDTIRIEYV